MGRPVDAMEELIRFSRVGAARTSPRDAAILDKRLNFTAATRWIEDALDGFRKDQNKVYFRDVVSQSWGHARVAGTALHRMELLARRADSWGTDPSRITPFWVSPDISDLLAAAVKSFPIESWTISPELLPCPEGWVWFDHQHGLPLRHLKAPLSGYWYSVRAIIWSQDEDGLLFTVLGYQSSDDWLPEDFDKLSRIFYGYWPWGMPSVAHIPRLYTEKGLYGEEERGLMDYAWMDGQRRMNVGKIQSSDHLEFVRLSDLSTLSVFGSLLEFLRQRIAVTTSHHLDRASRRRLPRRPDGSEHQEIRTITLRARDYQHRDDAFEEGGRDYNCRWLVRGHWHNYWVGTNGNRRLEPRLLTPYVKGPEGKPLKRTIDLFKVSR